MGLPFPSLLGMMFLTAGVVAVAALAKGPKRPALPAAPARRIARDLSRLATLPAPTFHARFSLN
jgi:hypothetical protein